MKKILFLQRGIGLLAGVLLLAACRPPKYVQYASPYGDFTCDVPWGWASILDSSGSDYVNAAFTGPLEPDFYRGVPSFSIRWYRLNAPHRLPDGSYETYVNYEDYARQLLRDVYGPDGKMWAGEDEELARALARNETFAAFRRIKVSDWEAYYFVVYHAAPAAQGQTFGVVGNDRGERMVEERHAYALLPMNGGFYALIYPATRQGFEKYKPAFFQLVNSFHALKDGPAGPKIDYGAASNRSAAVGAKTAGFAAGGNPAAPAARPASKSSPIKK